MDSFLIKGEKGEKGDLIIGIPKKVVKKTNIRFGQSVILKLETETPDDEISINLKEAEDEEKEYYLRHELEDKLG